MTAEGGGPPSVPAAPVLAARARISAGPLDPAALLAQVAGESAGAVVLFTGLVRGVNAGRRVVTVHYEAYAAMAEAELDRIVAEAVARFPGSAIAAAHRTGMLAVGETSVAVAAAHAHRAAAFDACRYVVEELKRRVPIWKHEHYADGSAAWLDGVAPAATTTAAPEATAVEGSRHA